MSDQLTKEAIAKQLEDTIKVEQKYQLAIRKLASYKKQVEIRDTVLELVSNGIIDPHEARLSVEKFTNNPDEFDVTKQAHLNGIPIDILGEVQDISSGSGDKDGLSPAEEFESSLRDE